MSRKCDYCSFYIILFSFWDSPLSSLLVLSILKFHLDMSSSGSFSFNLLYSWKAFHTEVLCSHFNSGTFSNIISSTISFHPCPWSCLRKLLISTVGLGSSVFKFSHIFHLFLFVLHLRIYLDSISLITYFNLIISSFSLLFDVLNLMIVFLFARNFFIFSSCSIFSPSVACSLCDTVASHMCLSANKNKCFKFYSQHHLFPSLFSLYSFAHCHWCFLQMSGDL